MRYTVLWVPGAERELAELWLDQATRGEITEAANRIDRLLENDPQQQGESRPTGRRILFETPLAVTFRVLPEDRIVRVLEVWRVAKRKRGH